MPEQLRTSEDWMNRYIEYVIILNPAGWKKPYDYSWSTELISEQEFKNRLHNSTVRFLQNPEIMFGKIEVNNQVNEKLAPPHDAPLEVPKTRESMIQQAIAADEATPQSEEVVLPSLTEEPQENQEIILETPKKRGRPKKNHD